MKRRKWIFIVPAAITGMVLFAALGGWIVERLWNWLMPDLFGWHALTFWQAIGLLVLCRILFGGVGRFKPGRRRMGGRAGERVAASWIRMTPEERERFRQELRQRADPSAGSHGNVAP